MASFAALSLIVISGSADANHSWGGYHWSRTSTLSIPLGSNVSSDWQVWPPQSDWSAAAAFDFRLISGTTNRASCAPVYGRVEICSYAYGNTNWLGIANVWTNGEHIVQATVQLNDSYFHSASYYNTPSWRRFVVCQELGHVVGLDHQDLNQNNANLGSCMDYTGDPTGKLGTNGSLHNLGPGKHDFEQLDQIYGHVDASQLSSTRLNSSGTATRLPPGEQGRKLGQARAGLTPREWGQAVAFDAKGRPRRFVKDLGDGIQQTTFVTWADLDHPHEH